MGNCLTSYERRYVALELDAPADWDDTDLLDAITRALEDRAGIRVADAVMDPDQETAEIMRELSAA